MSIQVQIVLDSGCLLEKEESQDFCEVGYYQCSSDVSDIRIYINGDEVSDSYPANPFKLGDGNCTIEIRHKDRNGSIKHGVTSSKTCCDRLLDMHKHLYGEMLEPDRAKFDYVFRFNSGKFRDSMVKNRKFKEYTKQRDGTYAHMPGDAIKEVEMVSHDLAVHYTLEDGEAIELAKGKDILWSSEGRKIEGLLVIELIADHSTAEQLYCHSFKGERDKYWVPNQGDPPPTCPCPPCLENGG